MDPAGVKCRIVRREPKRLEAETSATRQTGVPSAGPLATAKPMAAWACTIERSQAFAITYDEAQPPWQAQRYIVTAAEFAFDPDDEDDEAEQLERARRYCVDVAHAIKGLRPALEGLLARVEREIKDAVQEHRAIPVKFGGDSGTG